MQLPYPAELVGRPEGKLQLIIFPETQKVPSQELVGPVFLNPAIKGYSLIIFLDLLDLLKVQLDCHICGSAALVEHWPQFFSICVE